jgi:hypothetical protein
LYLHIGTDDTTLRGGRATLRGSSRSGTALRGSSRSGATLGGYTTAKITT